MKNQKIVYLENYEIIFMGMSRKKYSIKLTKNNPKHSGKNMLEIGNNSEKSIKILYNLLL